MRINIAIVTLVIGMPAFTADVPVAPGGGLQAAIDAATAGDVLILSTGTYTSATQFVINKDLTLRAGSAGAAPVVDHQVTVQSGINVTLQGLTLNSPVISQGPTELAVVQNTFTPTARLGFSIVRPQNLLVIGNDFQSQTSNTFPLDFLADQLVYVAGNTIFSAVQVDVRCAAPNLYFVGNNVESESQGEYLFDSDNGQVVANRFAWRTDQVSDSMVRVTSGTLFAFRNNVFKVASVTMALSSGRSMLDTGTAQFTVIENNVFDGQGLGSNASGVIVRERSRVRGNIFTGLDNGNNIGFINGTVEAISETTHNLCFGNMNPCPTGDGNMDADPLFVDTMDYQLGAMSPAIDAGPLDAFLLDVDGTRVDMGLYGGSFPIDQYDVQRDSMRLQPFLYPVFDAATSLDGLGNVMIDVVAVARLR